MRVEEKLKDVSNQVEKMARMGNNEDSKVISELVDDIQGAVTDCQVSDRAKTGSVI